MDEADAVADAATVDTTELTLVATTTWPEAVAAEADAVTVSMNDAVWYAPWHGHVSAGGRAEGARMHVQR